MVASTRVRFRADDIWDVPDDGKRYEVIEGELVITTAPDLDHQRPVGGLHGYIWTYVRRQRTGEVFVSPVGLILDEENGIQPDLVYVSNERRGILTRRGIRGVPDLVVEVLSPSTEARDRGVKLRRYAAAGVQHYWIVDPATRTLDAHRLTDTGYELTGTYGPGSVFLPEIFPGLEISVDDLWG
ncbi:MAG TPA: Uma2 family endonuclease [Chloroflexota bacterium]|nr:Uma2 family endonuclease [Chloroflexota bacterium]